MKTWSKVKYTAGEESELDPVQYELELLSRRLSSILFRSRITVSEFSRALQNTPEGSLSLISSIGWERGHRHSGKLIGVSDRFFPSDISSWISLQHT